MKGEAAEELRLPADALKRFRYLNRSGCTAIPGTDDVADFQLVQHAMDAVNIDKKAQACAPPCLSVPRTRCRLCHRETVCQAVLRHLGHEP